MIEDKKLNDLLIKGQLMDEKKLDDCLKEAKKTKTALFDFIAQKNLVPEPQLYEVIAGFFKLPLVDLKDENIRRDILFMIPEPIASAHEIVAFGEDGEKIKIALTDPTDLETLEFLKKTPGS